MTIDGRLTLDNIEAVLYGREKIEISTGMRSKVIESYEFLNDFSKDKVIYGINTGFGPMAQWRIEDSHLKELQYNIIRSHSTGAGERLPDICVKAAMISRLMTFLQGHSGVHVSLVDLLVEFINRDICPVIPRHGSVGASGDLVQLAHLALALIGEGPVSYNGEIRPAAEVMEENGLEPIEMHIREGLAVTNGTAVMTGIGLVNWIKASRMLKWSVLQSVMLNETVSSYDDFMSEVLNGMKHHPGQIRIAGMMRNFAAGSQLLRNRQAELFHRSDEKVFHKKVQPYYSLRCIPQILGPVLEEIDAAGQVLEDEVNAVDDNPVVDKETCNVYHGGNFHGDYVSYEMDKLKIALTRVTMLAERQMNYLFHDRINGILPPFLNLGVLGLNYGMQACQFTATSTTAECQTLSNPMYVHSIPNNNDNQDIVSMGTNSALICAQVVENCSQVMAIHLMALAQAVDCLNVKEKLSPASKILYTKVRELVPAFIEDSPKYMEIKALQELLLRGIPGTIA
ncbi:MAG: histidine ammonia-lyase [Candidatus Cryptobacteroides sp.]